MQLALKKSFEGGWMSEHDLLTWMVPAFGSIISFIGVGIFSQLKKMTMTIQALSVDLAVIAERVNGHEKRINRIEETL